jgi:hypothetical protein
MGFAKAAADAMQQTGTEQQQNLDDSANQAYEARREFANSSSAASQQRWNNVVGDLNSTTPSIQDTAAQQQANLQATAAAIQQRQQAEAQARLAAAQNAETKQTTPSSARSTPSNTNASSSSTTAAAAVTPNTNGNPYSSTPAQGSYNPYTGAGSGSIQGSCTDMTGSVQGSVKIGTDGWVIGYLTNNSTETLFVSYTFKQNGVPSKDMANAGGTSIQGGQTVGGEGQGLYSTGADKNQSRIYWYAVRQADHDKYGCVHNW